MPTKTRSTPFEFKTGPGDPYLRLVCPNCRASFLTRYVPTECMDCDTEIRIVGKKPRRQIAEAEKSQP